MIKGFFSYCHVDEDLRNQLDKHLSFMKRQGLVDMWYDRRIVAGSDIDDAIDENLEEASIILLLVSPDFLASDYCFTKEMARAIERHKEKTARVIPVILRPCDWAHPPLNHLLAVPRDGKAITTWANIDEAFTDVAKQIRRAIEELQSESGQAIQDASARIVRTEPSQDGGMAPVRASMPRSSNLRLKKEFTDFDRDQFLHAAFDYIARYFDSSLQELQARNPDVQVRFKLVDANRFTAAIYRNGKSITACTIRIGSSFGSSGEIAFVYGESASSNTSNDMLTVGNDDQALFLKPMGWNWHGDASAKQLSQEGASEYLWELLIRQAQ